MLSRAGILTHLVPCYTAGKNAEKFEGEDCKVHGITFVVPVVGCYFHSLIRGKIREKQRIDVRWVLYCSIIELEGFGW